MSGTALDRAKHPRESSTPGAPVQDLLNFQIEKMYASLSKAGDKVGTSSFHTALFLALAAAISVGDLADKPAVTIPTIGIEFSQWHAAGVLLLLSTICLYSLAVMIATERLLILKLDDLISERFRVEDNHWYLYTPSVFRSPEYLGHVSRLGRITMYVPLAFFASTVPVVLYLAFKVCQSLRWATTICVLSGASIVVLALAICTVVAMPHASAHRKNVLAQLEK